MSCVRLLSAVSLIALLGTSTSVLHPEDVQVFTVVVTGLPYYASKSCVLASKLPFEVSNAPDIQEVIRDNSMQVQTVLQHFLFAKDDLKKAETYQRLFACLLKEGYLRKAFKGKEAGEWLWTQLFQSAGVYSSTLLRDIASGLGAGLPKSLLWTHPSASTSSLIDPYNILHRAMNARHPILQGISHVLLFSPELPADFVQRMELLATRILADPQLPADLRTKLPKSVFSLLYNRTGNANNEEKSTALDAMEARRVIVRAVDVQTIQHALMWTTTSFVLKALKSHITQRRDARKAPLVTLTQLLQGRDVMGVTPLHYAVEADAALVIQALAAHYAEYDKQSNNTPKETTSHHNSCILQSFNMFGEDPLSVARRLGKAQALVALTSWQQQLNATVTCAPATQHSSAIAGLLRPQVATNAKKQPARRMQIGADGGALEVDSSGGWKAPGHIPELSRKAVEHVLTHTDGGCDVDVVDGNITALEFFTKYWVPQKPVLMRDAASKWESAHLWEKRTFMRNHGKEVWPFSVLPHIEYDASRQVTVADFVDRLEQCSPANASTVCAAFNDVISPYIFAIIKDTKKYDKELTRLPLINVKVPMYSQVEARLQLLAQSAQESALVPTEQDTDIAASTAAGIFADLKAEVPLLFHEKLQLYVGGTGSGAAVHYHNNAYNVLRFGQKHWVIQRPSVAEHMTVPIQQYVSEVVPNMRPEEAPLQCRQRAGDVFFIPQGWGHGILNLETVVGYSIEFNSMMDRAYE